MNGVGPCHGVTTRAIIFSHRRRPLGLSYHHCRLSQHPLSSCALSASSQSGSAVGFSVRTGQACRGSAPAWPCVEVYIRLGNAASVFHFLMPLVKNRQMIKSSIKLAACNYVLPRNPFYVPSEMHSTNTTIKRKRKTATFVKSIRRNSHSV